MKRSLFLFAAFLFILASGCKKQENEIPSGEDNPVFYFTGSVDSIPGKITAGIDNFYMYSSYTQDSSGMYTFVGTLKQVNCVTNCNLISFQINDNRRSGIGAASNIDSLFPGTYNYWTDNTVAENFIEFKSDPMPNSTPTSFSWDFGDGTTSTQENPVHSYLTPGIYNVCHTIFYNNGCANTICNKVKAQSMSDCMAFIGSTSLGGDSISFNVLANDTPISFLWHFGDSASVNDSSFLQNPRHNYSAPGIYKVRLDVTTINNCSTTVFKNVATMGYNTGCLSNFTYSKLYIPIPSNFSNVTITYVDKNNTIYSSQRTPQSTDCYFEILSVDEYIANENNVKTKKIHARFKCNASDGKKTISITSDNTVIAIAYP